MWCSSRLRSLVGAFIGLWILCVSSGIAAAAVAVGLVPTVTTVTAGNEFEVRIQITQSGPIFNGYNADITYDPARLTFLQANPLSLQEGSYMTNACASTQQFFTANGSALHVSHSLFCLNLFLSGPGELYVLRFRAASTGGPTTIHFQQSTFYRAGVIVPVEPLTDITIQVNAPTDVSPAAGKGVQLTIAPNPFNPTTVIEVESAVAGYQELRVHDAAGRLVATLQEGTFAAGTRRVVWLGRGDNGERLPSGSYLVSLHAGRETRTERVVLLK